MCVEPVELLEIHSISKNLPKENCRFAFHLLRYLWYTSVSEPGLQDVLNMAPNSIFQRVAGRVTSRKRRGAILATKGLGIMATAR